jgi:hypothetical protein
MRRFCIAILIAARMVQVAVAVAVQRSTFGAVHHDVMHVGLCGPVRPAADH